MGATDSEGGEGGLPAMVVYNDGMYVTRTETMEAVRTTLQNPEARAGKWYAKAGEAVQAKLAAAYDENAYPSDDDLKRLAREVGAPSPEHVRTFFQSINTLLMHQ